MIALKTLDVCEPGYAGSVVADEHFQGIQLCVDINECANNLLNKCSKDSFCTNTDGSYDCTCKSGYFGTGYECEDFDECVYEPCVENSSCENTGGGFTCICNDGFVAKPGTVGGISDCLKINKCLDKSCDFASGAICKDTVDGFECSCPSDMQGTGYNGDPCVKEVVRACVVTFFIILNASKNSTLPFEKV